jgi:hypothetical protein
MTTANNALFVIHPYKTEFGEWVFDDERVGLVKEPFVAGADTMIDVATQHFKDAKNGFILRFSLNPFPGTNLTLKWLREEFGGNWYLAETMNLEGWLCPALFKYFTEAPLVIYAQVLERKSA